MDREIRLPKETLVCFLLMVCVVFCRSSVYGDDVCSMPPFISGGVKPNVLFILDNSGSMNEFAYHEETRERCNDILVWTGYDEGKKYYGLFNPDKCYKYDNSHHYFYEVGDVVDDPDTDIVERAACLADNCTRRCFSGNWLNWWTMRRFDVAKKVLTGGRLANDATEYVLIGSPHERDFRRVFNDYATGDTPSDNSVVPSNKHVYYTPFRRAFYSYFYTRDNNPRNGQFVPLFNVVVAEFPSDPTDCIATYIGKSPDGDDYLPDDAIYENIGELSKSYPSYYVAVKVGEVGTDDPPAGLVQNVANRVRLGYMQFNLGQGPGEGHTAGSLWDTWDIDGDGTDDLEWRYGDGGRIRNYVGDDTTMVSPQGDTILEVVHNINEQQIEMWTPLSEVLNEAKRYFQQVSPCYVPGEGGVDFEVNDTWDPYYYSELGGKQYCAKSYIIMVTDGESNSQDGVNACGDNNETFPGDGNGYLDDIAFRIHTQDLRPDIPGTQTITLYTVFTFDDSDTARNELKRAARAGGFVDYDGDGEPYCDENCSTFWNDNFYPGTCDESSCNSGCYEWDENCDGVPDTYFEAQDGYLLERQLLAIFEEITPGGSAGSVATVTQQVLGEDIIVRGAFTAYNPEDPSNYVWKGHLECYWPYDGCSDYTTQSDCESISGCTWESAYARCSGLMYSFQKPENEGKFCSNADFQDGHCWDAGERLPDPGDRTIFTYINGSRIDFTSANAATLASYLDNDIDFNSDGNLDNQDVQALINWVRGDTTYDGTTARDRDGWILGDIIYSTPLVVGTPSLAAVPPNAVGDCSSCTTCEEGNSCAQNCFYCYRHLLQHRKKVVYVGANDGMLHAFVVGKWDESSQTWVYDPSVDNEIGRELWAYIPSNLLSEIKELARPSYGTSDCPHRSFVDLSLQAWDAYVGIDADGNGTLDAGSKRWRTILIGGERGGGDVYFAIDVKDPDNPQILWEYSVLRNAARSSGGSFTYPFGPFSEYGKVKNLRYSWSLPYSGRLRNPSPSRFSSHRPIFPSDDNATAPTVSCSEFNEWFAFIGGGGRVYTPPAGLSSDQEEVLYAPHLLALDLGTGCNLFQEIWADVLEDYGGTVWPEKSSPGDTQTIPYSISSPLVLDVLNAYGDYGQDGYTDQVYFGDLNGQFYSLHFSDNATGMQIDIRKTKDGLNGSNEFRSDRQPITMVPVGAFDATRHLRIYFGTGKYDDVVGEKDDRTDNETMSFYNLQLPISTSTPPDNGTFTTVIDSSLCDNSTWNPGGERCSWLDDNGTAEVYDDHPDCCESACDESCWTCIYDLHRDGERLIDQPLVAGGLVIFTSFVPSPDPCSSGGEAYLYLLDYQCGNIGRDVLAQSGFAFVETTPDNLSPGEYTHVDTEEGKVVAYVAHLGSGMPSRPILDSSAKYVLIQTSNAKIHRVRVLLPRKPLYLKGWKEETG